MTSMTLVVRTCHSEERAEIQPGGPDLRLALRYKKGGGPEGAPRGPVNSCGHLNTCVKWVPPSPVVVRGREVTDPPSPSRARANGENNRVYFPEGERCSATL